MNNWTIYAPLCGPTPITTGPFSLKSSDIFPGRGTQSKLITMRTWKVCTTDFPFNLLINSNLLVKSWSLLITVTVYVLLGTSSPQKVTHSVPLSLVITLTFLTNVHSTPLIMSIELFAWQQQSPLGNLKTLKKQTLIFHSSRHVFGFSRDPLP